MYEIKQYLLTYKLSMVAPNSRKEVILYNLSNNKRHNTTTPLLKWANKRTSVVQSAFINLSSHDSMVLVVLVQGIPEKADMIECVDIL